MHGILPKDRYKSMRAVKEALQTPGSDLMSRCGSNGGVHSCLSVFDAGIYIGRNTDLFAKTGEAIVFSER